MYKRQVQEMADYAFTAFDVADKYRTPVMILADGMLGQMMEPVVMPEPRDEQIEKPWACLLYTSTPTRPPPAATWRAAAWAATFRAAGGWASRRGAGSSCGTCPRRASRPRRWWRRTWP